MSPDAQNSPGGRPDRSKTSPPAKGTIKGKGTPAVKSAISRMINDASRLDHQAEMVLQVMIEIGDGEYFTQCAKCGSTQDVIVIKGRPRDARVTTDGETLIHKGNGAAECFGRLRVFGAESWARSVPRAHAIHMSLVGESSI